MKTLEIPKYLRLPLLLGTSLALLLTVGWVQQNNVSSLSQQIGTFQRQIDALPTTVAPKDKLALKKDQLTLEQGRVNAQNAIFSTVFQLLGGLFFFVTAYFTYCNVRVAEANLKATEEKQVTERFSKAIELLGSEKIEVRLGGIYALERIAKDSPKDHWTIIEILTSFIREKTTLVEPNSKAQSAPSFQKLTSEVQAALTVIKRRDFSREQEWQRIELQNTNLRRAKLDEANLIGARFNGANLIEADLVGANLSGAWLMGADLRFANLIGANLYRAKLDEANLSEASIVGANLPGAWLYKANLSGVNLGEARLDGAILYKANLSGAILSGASFYKANLSEADLSGADLSGANLSGANLTQEQISVAITDEKTKFPNHQIAPTSLQPEPLTPEQP